MVFMAHNILMCCCVPSERLLALLPADAHQQAANLLPTRDFEVAYRLDCRNLCADFQEDIEFRFSMGITSLIQRFLGPKGKKASVEWWKQCGEFSINLTLSYLNQIRLHPCIHEFVSK